MARLNWEKATAQARVRASGGEPFWLGLPQPASLQLPSKARKAKPRRRPRRALRATTAQPRCAATTMCSLVNAVVAEFAALSAWEQAAGVTEYQERIRRICSDARRMPDDTEHNRRVLRAATREMEGRLAGLLAADG